MRNDFKFFIKLMVVSFALFIAFITAANAQKVTTTKDGNYIALNAAKTANEGNKSTGKTFTDTKGNIYPVMVSKNNKLFYVRTSKTGNEYKVYIKL